MNRTSLTDFDVRCLQVGSAFEAQLQRGDRPDLAAFLSEVRDAESQLELARQLILLHIEYGKVHDEAVTPERFVALYPQYENLVRAAFDPQAPVLKRVPGRDLLVAELAVHNGLLEPDEIDRVASEDRAETFLGRLSVAPADLTLLQQLATRIGCRDVPRAEPDTLGRELDETQQLEADRPPDTSGDSTWSDRGGVDAPETIGLPRSASHAGETGVWASGEGASGEGASAEGTSGEASAQPSGRWYGDYELLDEIARGGMGVVYKARHAKLGRIVALKLLRSGTLADLQEVERFYREAASAAKLDHPGIVPVYEVGNCEGTHFFTMAYVEGESLAERIRERPLPAREAAEIVRRAAEAVGFAHRQGIIHRDLKPANILLDLAGTPRVTDFGLAKPISHDDQLTASGQILGTPSFMPPEQAVGRSDQVDARSDVYGLGAVLYALLCGRPPHQSDSVMNTLQAVLTQEPLPPRQLNASIPRDLETICQKCLEKDPRRRYATCDAVQAELQRFLDGEPIYARRIGPVGRLWRWSRRKPAVAALLATVALLLVSVATVATIGYVRTNLALAQKAEQERLARRRGRDARRAVGNYVKLVTEDELLREERFRPLLKTLLADALGYYEQFIHEAAEDPEALAELANACFDVGMINDVNGSRSAALVAFTQASQLFEQLLARDPDDDQARARLANCYSNQGILMWKMGRDQASVEQHRLAVIVAEDRYRRRPTQGSRAALAGLYSRLGAALFDSWQLEEAESTLLEAHAMQEELAEQGYDDILLNLDRVRVYHELADLFVLVGKLHRAEQYLQKARIELDRLNKAHPEDVRIPDYLAANHADWAYLHSLRAQYAEALASCRQAVSISERLVNEYPLNNSYQESQARYSGRMAMIYRERGDFDEAETWFTRALASRERLANEAADVVSVQASWVRILNSRALALQQSGKLDEARQAFQTAIDEAKSVLDSHSGQPHIVTLLADCYHNLGILEDECDDSEGALELFEAARKLRESVPAKDPVQRAHRANTYASLAVVYAQLEKPEDAIRLGRQAIEIRQQLVNDGDHELRRTLMNDYWRIGEQQIALGELEAAKDAFHAALELYETPELELLDQDLRDQAAFVLYSLGEIEEGSVAQRHYLLAARLWGRLLNESAATARYARRLSAAQDQLAKLLAAEGEIDGAAELYRQAIEHGEHAVSLEPDSVEALTNLAISCNRFGLMQKKRGAKEDALQLFLRAEELYNELRSREPHDSSYAVSLAGALCNQGNVQVDLGNLDDALPLYAQAITLLGQTFPSSDALDSERLARTFLINCHGARASALGQLKRYTEAAEDWDRLVELADETRRDEFRWRRAKTQAQAGLHAEATAETDRLATEHRDSSEWLYRTGQLFAVAVAGLDETELPANEKAELSDRYASRAVELLTKVRVRDPAQKLRLLESDELLAPLHSHPDYQQLLESLKEPVPQPE